MKSVIYMSDLSHSRALKKYNVQRSKSDTALCLPLMSTKF